MRLTLPQPFEDLDHTADAGVRVTGASAGDALARLVLALGALLSGGAPVAEEREVALEVAGGPDLAGAAVALLREVLYRCEVERALPAACEVLRVDAAGAAARVWLGRRGPAHDGGLDVKAVTRHAAALEQDADGGWIGQAVFDL
ncbi:MAG: archease [Anaeromyxobacteraceae bacterium]